MDTNKKGTFSMYKFNKFILTLTLLSTTLIFLGCNNESNTSNNASTESIEESKITSRNAESIAAAALTAVDIVKGLPIQSGTLSSSSGSAASGKFYYSEFIIDQLSLIQQQNRLMGRNTSNASTGAVSKAFNCNLYLTGDIADESKLSVGDTASFSFDNCTYNSELILDGMIGITLTQVSEGFTGTPPFELDMDTVLTDFKVDYQGSVFVSNGALSMLINKYVSNDTTAHLSGTSMDVALHSSSDSDFLTLSNFDIELKESSTEDYSISQQGRIKIAIPFSSLNAFFTTLTPFTGNYNIGSGNPTAGELHLTGALGSQAWVIAQSDGVNIRINIDVIGNGLVDVTLMTTWTELQNLL
jgi:hypothetical protein